MTCLLAVSSYRLENVFIDRLNVNLDIFVFLFMFLTAARIGCTFPLSIPHEFEQFGLLHVFTKKIYRPRRDSNPVPPGSESTTLPNGYSGATMEIVNSNDNITAYNYNC